MKPRVKFPNLLSRLVLKKAFDTQFIIPPPPPRLLAAFLKFYERRCLNVDLTGIEIKQPIFLVGIHRSGTTMLQDILCTHPRLAYITNAMPSYRDCFCAVEHLRKRLKLDFKGERVLYDSVEVEISSPNEGVAFWREWFKEDPYALNYAPLGPNDLSSEEQEKIRTAIRKMIWCFGGQADRFFCKNPGFIPHLRLLNGLFPDAKFVHIVRDARTCANSMSKLYRLEQEQLERIRKQGKHGVYDDRPFVSFPRLPRLAEYIETYGPDSIQTTARLWNDALAEVESVKSELPAFHEVRYEDILANPREEIARTLKFCELPELGPENARYWTKFSEIGAIKHSNRYADYDVIEEICRDNLRKYGYV